MSQYIRLLKHWIVFTLTGWREIRHWYAYYCDSVKDATVGIVALVGIILFPLLFVLAPIFALIDKIRGIDRP